MNNCGIFQTDGSVLLSVSGNTRAGAHTPAGNSISAGNPAQLSWHEIPDTRGNTVTPGSRAALPFQSIPRRGSFQEFCCRDEICMVRFRSGNLS